MEKTVCELFAGVGGFRCGLNYINTIEAAKKPEKWKTVWFSQWEPGKKNQWAHDCYVNRFGKAFDKKGHDTTNMDIAEVIKKDIPDHNLLVGGFPCQDYSVARSLNGEQGIEGKKGVLWWSIRDVIKAKKPPFILLENVDRLLKSPSKQRGRDFAIILACLQDEGYAVEWRVINAAEYGSVQRRRRIFIFAYHKKTTYAKNMKLKGTTQKKTAEACDRMFRNGFFATCFPVEQDAVELVKMTELDKDVVAVSEGFKFEFENSGLMQDGVIYSIHTTPEKNKSKVLGEILQTETVEDKYYIPESKLYYDNKEIRYSDETECDLPKEKRQTWQYIKGGKKRLRIAASGHKYIFSEGPIPMIDKWDAPARTMLTSEGSFNRSTHIVEDRRTGKVRILTPIETERIQGFPDNWTKDCLVNDKIVSMPERMRYFCMGNALVVDLVKKMECVLEEIFDNEM